MYQILHVKQCANSDNKKQLKLTFILSLKKYFFHWNGDLSVTTHFISDFKKFNAGKPLMPLDLLIGHAFYKFKIVHKNYAHHLRTT